MESMNNNTWYIIRCDRAGVFFAHIAERRGDEADLTDARRIGYQVIELLAERLGMR